MSLINLPVKYPQLQETIINPTLTEGDKTHSKSVDENS